MDEPITVRPERFGGSLARRLTAAALADLAQRYGGEGDSTPIGALDFDPPGGLFVVGYVYRTAAACGGWRTLAADGSVAEIKRMYTAPAFRGRGVARAVLAELEATARAAGKRRLVLETGHAQPEAIALYIRCGYEPIDNFGHYRDHAGCVSFGRDLR